MQRNFFIQKGNDPAKDIFAEWGIVVNATRGLMELPNLKNPFSRDWVEEQGVEEYIPDIAVFSGKEVEIDITYYGMAGQRQFRNFIKYLVTPKPGQFAQEPRSGVFQFFSPYRNTGARLRYMGMSFSKEKYRRCPKNIDRVQATLKFMCTNGLSFAASSTGKPSNSLTFTITEGQSIDVFYSDGTRDLNRTASFSKNNVMFCIINPSSLDAVSIS